MNNKLLALPAGPDTPIRAGALEGYHLGLDNFEAFLTHEWAPGDFAKISASLVAQANTQKRERFEGAENPPSPLAELYYDYIRDHCPPG